MKKVVYGLIMGSLLMPQNSFSMEKEYPHNVDALLEHIQNKNLKNGIPLDNFLLEIKENKPNMFKDICNEVQSTGTTFYTKAQGKIGNLRTASVVRICKNHTVEQLNTKTPLKTQPKLLQKSETELEKVKLKPVNLEEKKGQTFSQQQQQVKEAESIIIENVKILEKKEDPKLKEKLEKFNQDLNNVKKRLQEAEEHYNNLAMAISVMREDFKELKRLLVFKPLEHENDSPEDYLEAAQKEPTLEKGSKEQLQIASQLYQQAKENLEKARLDLVRINEEMLNLTK